MMARLDRVPVIIGGQIGYRVFRQGSDSELGCVFHDQASGRWFCGLPGGFPASSPIYRNDSEALDALQRMAGPASSVPPLYARMTLGQLEAEEEAISRNLPILGNPDSQEKAEHLLALIRNQKAFLALEEAADRWPLRTVAR